MVVDSVNWSQTLWSVSAHFLALLAMRTTKMKCEMTDPVLTVVMEFLL